MRKQFAESLHDEMTTNPLIYLIVGDLGYGMFDKIRTDFPNRFYNVQAAEQVMLDIGIGLAMSGKIPIVYSITPFLILRPFESIRTYINHEKIPVIMVGSGRDEDYQHDGISHFATDIPKLMEGFENIIDHYPLNAQDIPFLLKEIINNPKPTFISLKR